MSFYPPTLRRRWLVRRRDDGWAQPAGWAALAAATSVVVGGLAGSAPMVLFGAAGIIASAAAFFAWPVTVLLGLLLLRPAIDDSADALVLGPANALGAIGIAIFVGGTAVLLLRGPRIRVPAVTGPFVAFLGVGLLAVISAPSPTEAIGFWVQLCSLFLVFCMCAKLFRTPGDLRRLVAVVLASAAVPILVALVQVATGTGLSEGGKGESAAAPGTISHPNGTSFFLMLVLTVGIVTALEGPPRRLRLPLVIGLVLGTGAFIATYTRSAWLGMAAILGLLATVQYRRLVGIGALGLVVLTLALPSTVGKVQERFSDLSASSASYSTNSWQWRLENWSRMLPYATDSPLTGHGLGSYLPLTDEEFGKFDYDFIQPGFRPGEQVVYAHNDYLFLSVEMGLPGAALWLGVFAGLVLTMWRARACPAVRPLATGMAGVAFATAVGSGFDNVVLYTVVLLPLMAICGGIAGVHQQWKASESGGPS